MILTPLSDSNLKNSDLEQRITDISKTLITQLSQKNGFLSCDSFGTLFTNSKGHKGKQLFQIIGEKAEELTTNSEKPIIYIPTEGILNQGIGIRKVIERFRSREDDDILRKRMKPWIDALDEDFRAVYMTEEESDNDDLILNSENYQGFSTRETYLGHDFFTLSTLFGELRRRAEISFHPLYDFSRLNKEDFKKYYYSTMLQREGSTLVDKELIENEEILGYGGEYKIRDLLPQRVIDL